MVDRLFDVIKERHCDPNDETLDEFSKWIRGPHNSLIRQLATKKHAPGGEIHREVVKSCVLRLAWKAHQTVAENSYLAFRALAESLEPALTENELNRFNNLFRPQSWWGGLSLLMLLKPRARQLKPAILEGLLAESDGRARIVAASLKMLQFYGQMVSIRRDADNWANEQRRTLARLTKVRELARNKQFRSGSNSDSD